MPIRYCTVVTTRSTCRWCAPLVTRVERYAGHCPCCGGVALAAIPAGLEDGSPFSVNIVALAIYLRFTHAISCRRLTQLFLHLYALQISEGALDAMLQRAKSSFDNEVAAILARLRRSRIVCSDETSVRIDGRTHWNWVFQNDQVVIHIMRNSRAANVVTETMAGHRPSIWVPTCMARSRGMPICGRSVWRIMPPLVLCRPMPGNRPRWR
jgi:transposase